MVISKDNFGRNLPDILFYENPVFICANDYDNFKCIFWNTVFLSLACENRAPRVLRQNRLVICGNSVSIKETVYSE